MSLTFHNRRFQWAGKRITDRQMTRAVALRELTREPISVMIQKGFDLYLQQEETRLKEIAEMEAGFASDVVPHAPV